LPSLSCFGREVARLKLVILVLPWVVRVSGGTDVAGEDDEVLHFEVFFVRPEGSFPRLNTVEDGQDGEPLSGADSRGKPRGKE
jgi:hypothetical protein